MHIFVKHNLLECNVKSMAYRCIRAETVQKRMSKICSAREGTAATRIPRSASITSAYPATRGSTWRV